MSLKKFESLFNTHKPIIAMVHLPALPGSPLFNDKLGLDYILESAEKDLISLRKYACSGNNKFFIGTDSAPHHITTKIPNMTAKPGIFSAPCSIELYASVFEEENALDQFENFCSINGPNFYSLPINLDYIELIRSKWLIPEFTEYKDIKIKNFMGGKEMIWKVLQ